TRSGVLMAKKQGDWIELDFPATREEKSDAPPLLLESLGIKSPRYVGRNKFDYIVEAASEEEVRRLKPDHSKLRQVPARGVIVTSLASNGGYDFVSRYFAPGSGIDEDPVTGSSHCCLTPYWSERLGKNELVAYQASARGGTLRVRLDGDRGKLGGRAAAVLGGGLAVLTPRRGAFPPTAARQLRRPPALPGVRRLPRRGPRLSGLRERTGDAPRRLRSDPRRALERRGRRLRGPPSDRHNDL